MTENRLYVRVVDSRELLRNEGYSFFVIEEPPSIPDYGTKRFADVLPELLRGDDKARSIANAVMYRHQEEALEALEKGLNVVLLAGTGSGKTECWAMYAIPHRLKTLAIYPTLALAEDQFRRLKSYSSCIGAEVFRVDAQTLEEMMRRLGIKARSRIAHELSRALILVTNPAFLMADLKRIAIGRESVLYPFLRDLDLIVVDELDFYGSSRATLLLALIELIVNFISRKKPQIVILGATIGNPEDLANYLTKINGRATRIIYGKPFRALNRWIIVLGRNIERLYNLAKRIVCEDHRLAHLKPAVENMNSFLRYLHIVVDELRRYGYRVPEPGIEPEKIIASYALSDEDGVTIVFTPSIRSAEKLFAKVRALLPYDKQHTVAVHHHLVPKDRRSEIEQGLREGRIKVVISVRTLMQGIDIGIAVRVVHYGLPLDIRELKQREGRKGRRPYIPFTESIVIPVSDWDRELLSLGPEGLKEYLSLELENVYINPENEFVKLFIALAKLLMGTKLERDEIELLRRHRLIRSERTLVGRGIALNDRGRVVWHYLNFYEYGPPYGFPRRLETDRGAVPLEPVSRRDVVEKLQPYTFDLSNEAIVVDIDREGVREVRLIDIWRRAREDSILENALQYYSYVKRRWGEEPDLVGDVLRARLQSFVGISLSIPRRGFGVLREVPIAVYWVVESSIRRVVAKNGELYSYNITETIPLPARSNLVYEDLTYGYAIELPPSMSIEDVELGAALIQLALRFSKYRIAFREISFAVAPRVQSPPTLMVWEPSPCGLLETIDWREVDRALDTIGSRLHFILLKALSRSAAIHFLEKLGGDWSKAREIAKVVLSYVARAIRGIILPIKPTITAKNVVAVFAIKLGEKNEVSYIVSAVGDGFAEESACTSLHGAPCIEAVASIKRILDHAYTSNAVVVHYSQLDTLREIASEDRTAALLLSALERENRVVDLAKVLEKEYGFAPSLTELVSSVAKHFAKTENLPSIPNILAECSENCLPRLKEFSNLVARTLFVAATGRLPIPTAKQRA